MSQPAAGIPELLSVSSPDWAAVLVKVLAHFQCATGTIHRTDPSTGLLTLVTQHGIPPHVLPMLLPKIDNIPFGKGIAGCAAQRKEAVQTNVQGALAVPVVGADGKVLGVLGIGKMQPYDFSEAEIADLNAVAALVSAKL